MRTSVCSFNWTEFSVCCFILFLRWAGLNAHAFNIPVKLLCDTLTMTSSLVCSEWHVIHVMTPSVTTKIYWQPPHEHICSNRYGCEFPALMIRRLFLQYRVNLPPRDRKVLPARVICEFSFTIYDCQNFAIHEKSCNCYDGGSGLTGLYTNLMRK